MYLYHDFTVQIVSFPNDNMIILGINMVTTVFSDFSRVNIVDKNVLLIWKLDNNQFF